MEYDDDVPEQPTRLLDDLMPYCETGTLVALNWLRTAHAVLEPGNHADLDKLRSSVQAAIDDFLTHIAICEKCNKDWPTFRGRLTPWI
jgi:hypothetical protein